MRRITRAIVGSVVGLSILGGTIGLAYAESPTPTPTTPPAAQSAPQPGPGYGLGPGWMMGGWAMGGPWSGGYSVPGALAELTGFTAQEIQAKRADGKSFVQIAAEKGVTEQQLLDKVLAARKDALAASVKAGRITQAQADSMLQYMESRIKADLEWTPTPGAPGVGPGFGPGMMGRGGCWGGFQNQPSVQPGRGPGAGMRFGRS